MQASLSVSMSIMGCCVLPATTSLQAVMLLSAAANRTPTSLMSGTLARCSPSCCSRSWSRIITLGVESFRA